MGFLTRVLHNGMLVWIGGGMVRNESILKILLLFISINLHGIAVIGYSDNPKALATSSQRKLRFFSGFQNLTLVFQRSDGTYCVTSTDGGKTWSSPTSVCKDSYPSLDVFESYKWRIGLNQNNMMLSATGINSTPDVPTTWEIDTLKAILDTSYGPTAIEVDTNDHIHLVNEERTIISTDSNSFYYVNRRIRYRKFDANWNIITSEVVRETTSYESTITPAEVSLTVDNLTNEPHILWNWRGTIYYGTRETGEWWTVLVDQPDCKEPFIDYFYDGYHEIGIIWVKDTNGLGEVYGNYRHAGEPLSEWPWLVPVHQNFSDTYGNDSRTPQLVSNSLIFAENINGNWEICYGGIDRRLSNDYPGKDILPQVAAKRVYEDGYPIDSICVVWMRENLSPPPEWYIVCTTLVFGSNATGIQWWQPELNIVNAFPNPFRTSVSIKYKLNPTEEINCVIYDISGRQVRVFNSLDSRGTINWDGTDAYDRKLPAGAYFYRLSAKNGEYTGKLILLR